MYMRQSLYSIQSLNLFYMNFASKLILWYPHTPCSQTLHFQDPFLRKMVQYITNRYGTDIIVRKAAMETMDSTVLKTNMGITDIIKSVTPIY